MPEVEYALLEVIDNAARCPDQDVHTRFQSLALLLVVHPAVREPEIQVRVAAQQQGVLVDLEGEFTGRRQHQRTRMAARFVARVGQQALKYDEQESCRLAGPGLGLAGDVPARQGRGQRQSLDRRAIRESGITYSGLDGRQQVERRESDIRQGFACIVFGHLQVTCDEPVLSTGCWSLIRFSVEQPTT